MTSTSPFGPSLTTAIDAQTYQWLSKSLNGVASAVAA